VYYSMNDGIVHRYYMMEGSLCDMVHVLAASSIHQ
jgi:hypothetical protein